MFINRIRLALAILLILQLTACGFHLQGASPIADRFNPLYVVEDQLEPAQLTLILTELSRSSAELVDLAQGSNRLRVRLTPLETRQVARSSLTNVELFQLTLGIQFSVKSASGVYLLKQRELVQKVDVELDNANVLGHDRTINSASLELQRKLIRSMISQLSR